MYVSGLLVREKSRNEWSDWSAQLASAAVLQLDHAVQVQNQGKSRVSVCQNISSFI